MYRFALALQAQEPGAAPIPCRCRRRRLGNGRHFKIIADYLVGCDGAGSEVRKALDITLSGKAKLSYSTSILLKCKGLLDHIDKGQAERYIFIGPEGTWGNWTVVDGKDEWRLTILGGTEREQISLEQAHASVRRALGADLPYEIQSLITWRRTELIADKFGAGRILLAGNSVHTMSPTGGMGMNTGMGDAVDLGWKLSAVMQGWGGPHLLQTYETERRPVAIRMGAFSTHNFSAWAANEDCSRILDDDSKVKHFEKELDGTPQFHANGLGALGSANGVQIRGVADHHSRWHAADR